MNLKFLIIAALLSLSMGASAQNQYIKYKNYLIPVTSCEKPRVAVTLDLVSNGGDPNEWQDLAHFLIYSNYFDVRAIVASKGPNNTVGSVPDIKAVLALYRDDFEDLSEYATINSLNPYQSEEDLSLMVRANDSSGRDLIRAEAEASSSGCPLHVLVWGASDVMSSVLSGLSETAKDNYSIIAIGSSNANADLSAWNNMLALGGDRVTYTHTDDTFRGFYHPQPSHGGYGNNSSPICNVTNIELYPGMPVETYMNNLSASTGLRRAIKDSRDEASYLNCNQLGNKTNPTYNYSARFSDFTTTLYLLDKFRVIPGLDGNVESIFKDRSGPLNFQQYRDEVYGDFLTKVNAIY